MDSYIECEPCKERNKKSRAVIFCSTCQEYQCKDCADVHVSCKATRKHRLIDIEQNLSFSKLSKTVESRKLCRTHTAKQVEFYCVQHRELLCTLCLLTGRNHRECKHEVDISSCDLAKEDFTNKLVDDFNKSILKSKYAVSTFKEAYDNSKRGVDVLVKRLNGVRDCFLTLFEEQKAQVIEHASKAFSEKTEKGRQKLQKSERLLSETEEAYEFLHENIKSETGTTLFHSIMLMFEQLEALNKQTEKVLQNCSVIEVSLDKTPLMRMIEERNQMIKCNVQEIKIDITAPQLNVITREDFYEHVTNYGKNDFKSPKSGRHVSAQLHKAGFTGSFVDIRSKLDIKEQTQAFETKSFSKVYADCDVSICRPLQSNESKLEAKPTGSRRLPRSKSIGRLFSGDQTASNKLNTKVNTSSKTTITLKEKYSFNVSKLDGEEHCFGGLVCLADDRLVLSDVLNKKLLILALNHQTEDTIFLQNEPGALALLSQECIAVCLMKTNNVVLMRVKSEKIEVDAFLRVRFHPKCIQRLDEQKMIVSMAKGNGEWYMDILQHDGTPVQEIKLTGFDYGYKIAIQKVPDEQSGSFRILQYCDLTEKLRCFKFNGETVFCNEVDRVSCVLVDSKGYIFLVRFTGEIQILSPDGKLKGKLHKNNMRTAKCSAFSFVMDKMYVTKYRSSTVHVLDILRS